MRIYLLLFFFYFLCGIYNFYTGKKKHNLFSIFITILPMLLLVAFRGEYVGSDTITYKFGYDSILHLGSLKSLLNTNRMETGYLLVSYYCTRIGFSYFDFQVVITFFIYFSWSLFFKRYSERPFVSMFFFAITTMSGTMNVVRMQIAIAILLFSIPFIQKKQPLRFIAVILLASMFHKTSVLFSVLYPICTIKYNKKIIIFILLGAFAIVYMGASFFEALTSSVGMYEGYVDGKYFDSNRSSLGVIIDLSIQIIVLIYMYIKGAMTPIQYIDNKKAEINISYICIMMIWIYFALSIIGLTNNLMNRLSGYFSMSLLLLLPITFNKYSNRNNSRLFFFIVASCYTIKWIIIQTYRPEWNVIIPYKTFFD